MKVEVIAVACSNGHEFVCPVGTRITHGIIPTCHECGRLLNVSGVRESRPTDELWKP